MAYFTFNYRHGFQGFKVYLNIHEFFFKFQLVKNAGPVDILINNAGIFRCKEFSETPINDFDV